MTSVLSNQRQRRSALKTELEQLLDRITVEKRDMTQAEDNLFQSKYDELSQTDERIFQLEEIEARNAAAAVSSRQLNVNSGWSVTGEPEVYRDPLNDPSSASFFRDLYDARNGHRDAIDRLARNNDMQSQKNRNLPAESARNESRSAYYAAERRAGDMSTGAGGGGEFAPPDWMVEKFVALARAGRVTADLLNKDQLPSGISSINLPKVAGGTTVAVQATQNSALSDTAMTTTSVSSGITTIGGKQIVALQLVQQSGIPLDRVILGDLARAYATQLDLQVLNGLGSSGELRGLAVNAVATAYTTASPKFVDATTNANSFNSAVIRAVETVYTTLYAAPTAIIMHPRRWAWCLEALDGNGRPMITPGGAIFNAAATAERVAAQGAVGTLAGVPVYTDPNISTTGGTGTNQDEVYVLKADEAYLWETDLQLQSFDATYADSASLLYRALGYAAAIPDRLTAAVNVIRGTGLVAPTL